jgi:hypothetical protein
MAPEVQLRFRMLCTNDGNDSLKRVLEQRIGDDLDPDDNMASVQRSSELPTTQFVGGDRYLSREYINRFTGDSAPTDMLAGDDEVSLSLSSPIP